MTTNPELIEILKPAIDSIKDVGVCSFINDVQIKIERSEAGEYKLQVSAWAKGNRIKCQSLDSVAQDVAAYDEGAERRKEKEAEIAKLQAELAALQPKPTTTE